MESVALSIENKVRELDGKLWLGLNLVDRGYDVTIGPSWEIKSVIDEIDPDVYFAKDVGDGNVSFFNELHEAGITVCGFAPEVGVNSSVDTLMEHRQNILNHIDVYFAWGETTASSLRSFYNNTQNKDKIKVTGNPRFDLVTRDLRSIYSGSAEQLNKQYGEFILINTNFGVSNATNREDTYSSIKEMYPDRDPYHEGIVGSRVLYSLIELVFYLLSEDIDNNIVIRPHPGEDHSLYKDIFEPYDDVYVRHYGDVRSWIAAADGVIHHDCTTGIEAALMETPVLSYQTVRPESTSKPLSQVVSYEVSSRDEVLSWIRNLRESADSYTMSPEQAEQVRGFFPNIDELAAPKICDIIDNMAPISGNSSKYMNTTKEKLELRIKSSRLGPEVIHFYDYIRDKLTNGDHQSSRSRQRQKFPGLGEEELTKKIQLFSDHIQSDSMTFGSVPNTRHSYTISRT